MEKIDTQKLKELREKSDAVAILNVLGPDKFRQQHIPGSENIPVSESNFTEEVARSVGGRDKPVVVYCADESCNASEKAAQALDDAGFETVYDFVGGMQAWQEAGEPVQAGPK
jgi:rhodanese-related sulfurtransferase